MPRGIRYFMKTQTRKKTKPKKSVAKKTGRPRSTGSGIAMMVRMHKPMIRELDSWIGEAGITRPEAIRQLVRWALDNTKPQEEPAEEPPLHIVKRARENELRK